MNHLKPFNESNKSKLVQPLSIDIVQEIEDILVGFEDDNIKVEREVYSYQPRRWNDVTILNDQQISIRVKIQIEKRKVDQVYSSCIRLINYCSSMGLRLNIHIKPDGTNHPKYGWEVDGTGRHHLNDMSDLKLYLRKSEYVTICINTGIYN